MDSSPLPKAKNCGLARTLLAVRTLRASFLGSLLVGLTLGAVTSKALSETEADSPQSSAEKLFPEPSPLSFWIDLYRAEPVRFLEVMNDLSTVDIIYTGEIHTLDRHHYWQTRILSGLIEKKKGQAVLALEPIEQFQQPLVDRFNDGEFDFNELAEAMNWSNRWSNFEDYRALLELAQKNDVPVLALNARAETIRKIGRQGLESLSQEERNELPETLNFDDPQYRQLLNMLLMVHASMDESVLDRIFEAQVARDEKMASTLAAFLSQPGNQNRTALVIAGSGHIQYGLGTVSRVRSRLPEKKDRIVLMTESGELVLSEEEAAMSRDISITHEDLRFLQQPKADYLQVTELQE
ncbi:ChaN family lipoprotein [Puniceicoccus vermicola]|uniref:ChaN family lipoprotein n=1 Tax=Puniceicoccus vermicola TaxID=388746 RepID=A0A7X1B2S2_9BACT|nr:ChaN family lipoprotein [Puniceicoccus vermicola]MBC2604329.1 ChaN family lipoprotein [Puniceicoccus vermicola]